MSTDPQSFGESDKFAFSRITESQIALCRQLDDIFKEHGLEIMASKMFEGAIFVSNRKLRHNPDWLSQAANSLREILYPFYSGEKKGYSKKVLTERSAVKNRDFSHELGTIYNTFNSLAHHGNSDKSKLSKEEIEMLDFDQLIAKFEAILREALKRQLDLYNEVDAFFTEETQSTKDKGCYFINANPDARDYFFSKAPIEWISWLNENDFFDILNKEAEDKARYSFRMPELTYLSRVVESNGDEAKVIEIMEKVDCVKNFNPEVVDQFSWIAQKLSTKSLIKLVPKIKKENWISLMKGFRESGHSYQPIIKKLSEAKEFESLLVLAEVLFTLERKGEHLDNYFVLKDVGESEIFESLANLEGEYIEKGLELILNVLKQLVKEKEQNIDSSFAVQSDFHLYDVDLFEISINRTKSLSDREDLKSLVALLALFIKLTFSKNCEDNSRELYNKYFSNLPDTQWMWRIKIFAMHFCPEVFQDDLKEQLVRFLSTERYHDFLASTPEFYKILRESFPAWNEADKRAFVKNIIDYFNKKVSEEPEEKWIKEYGWRVLSSIADQLIEDEKNRCESNFEKKPDPSYKPETSISQIRGGSVRDRSPVDISAAVYPDILILLSDLKGNLSPDALNEKYKEDDFLNPRNTEGVGNAIKEDVKKRIHDYVKHASSFLDPDIHLHYTYSFLQGIEDYLRTGAKLNKADWEYLFKLFKKIGNTNREYFDEEKSKSEKGWLATWPWIENITADILKYFFTKDYKELFSEKRSFLLSILEYLLDSESPKPENETEKFGDLFHIAINSTRGVAFQALVNFVYQDGEKLKEDVLDLYKKTIENASLSIRFVIGYYLVSFYFRDKVSVKNMFEIVFLRSEGRYEEFFAAWEGYLMNTLYEELFEELQDYYAYALGLIPSVYSDRRKTRDLDEGIASHLALAFAHFDKVQYTETDKHPLLETLWNSREIGKQKEFISFIGRGIISNGNAGEDWFKEKNVKLEKLKAFWLLILDRDDLSSDIYSAFGFWVNHQKNIFDYGWLAHMMARTLEKSKGKLDWEYGILAKMGEFAKVDPEKTITILEKYLLDGILGNPEERKWFYLDDEKIAVFKDLYKAKPAEIKSLTNRLLEKGGQPFWPLKDIVEE